MGRRDNQLVLSDAQAITTSAYSSNVIDKGAAGALGKNAFLVARVNTAFTAGGAATLTLALRTSAALSGADLDSNAVDLVATRAWPVAQLTVGKELMRVPLPADMKGFIQGYASVATGPMTAGKLDWFVSADEPQVKP